MAANSTTSLKLDTELKERVQRLAESRRRSAHWVMREAVEQYVSREEKREQLKQDALAAWEHYQVTGLHVTAEEADAWLAKLEAGENAEAPECHSYSGPKRHYVIFPAFMTFSPRKAASQRCVQFRPFDRESEFWLSILRPEGL